VRIRLAAAACLAAGVVGATPAHASVAALSSRQLAGQRVIYSYSGLTPPAGLFRAIRAGRAAGVIFFGGNISGRAQIRAVIGRLQRAAARSPVKAPLLMMTDQEGGLVRRLPGAPALSEKQIGASPHPAAAARDAGLGAGRNLERAGMNVNLAPVLDVYRAPGDFIDEFGRSYSMRPRKVARLGTAFIRAQQSTGVAATAKHFPGLGAATRTQNTDERPVTLRTPLRALRTVDELPYRSAISAGVRLVMVSWARYPALGSRRPAGLSSAVVRGELRRRLGFTGVTITDALGAGALRAFGAVPDRAVLAAHAGMDLLLCAGGRVREGTRVVNALAGALRSGELERRAFAASARRVLRLRSAF
jgi:beta-N-acetylhexosaminidase